MAEYPISRFDAAYSHMVEKVKKSASRSQFEKFKETARQIGADESEAAFKDKLRRIAKPKPSPKDGDVDK